LRRSSWASEEAKENMSSLLDKARGKAKEVAGELLNRRDLKREGSLDEAKADADREASSRQAEAAQAQSEADVTAREGELAAEEMELGAEEAIDANASQLEQERHEEHRRIENQGMASEALVEAQENAQKDAATRDEVVGRRQRREALAEAADASKQADDARRQADWIDPGAGTD
jgi:uncharacterized protein YjbJ (UPF0337 family)